MGTLKIKGQTSGSVSLKAPDTGSDAILTLPGTTGELLPLAGGKILQIVRATDSTRRDTTSTSFVDASISVTITPQINTSAIIVVWAAHVACEGNANLDARIRLVITDNSNNTLSGVQDVRVGTGTAASAASYFITQYVTLVGYATPATTSATTYKVRFANFAVPVSVRNDLATGQLYAIEVSA
jgi:hypothetical protein